MKQETAIAEWKRALQDIAASDYLQQGGFYEKSISASYYAILHAARAALYVHSVKTESHSATRKMFSLHLINAGEIEREWGPFLYDQAESRLDADYNIHHRFTAEETLDENTAAHKFINRIRQYLLAKGFTEHELDSE